MPVGLVVIRLVRWLLVLWWFLVLWRLMLWWLLVLWRLVLWRLMFRWLVLALLPYASSRRILDALPSSGWWRIVVQVLAGALWILNRLPTTWWGVVNWGGRTGNGWCQDERNGGDS